MTKLPDRIRSGEVEAPDLFCGGTPCQAFSVAGLRKSLDDARGNLSLTFCEIANAIDHVRARRGEPPTIVFWENVPGVLSTKDNAFGCFLAALAGEDGPLEPPGGKWTNAGCVFGPARAVAWRVLDAQYFGLAQRRCRVFVVASARDGFDPAAVLFEFDGVRRDSAPSREARQGTAAIPSRSTAGGGFPGTDGACGGHVVSTFCIKGSAIGRKPEAGPQRGEVLADIAYTQNCVDQHAVAYPSVAQCLTTGTDGSTHALGYGSSGGQASVAVAVALRGFEGGAPAVLGDEAQYCLRASSGGGDKPHVLCETLYNQGFTQGAIDASTQETHAAKILRALREAVGEEAFAKWGLGILDSLQPPEILRQALHGFSIRPASFSRSWVVHCALSRSEDGPGWLLQSLREAGCERCASQGWQPPEQLARELGAYLSELSQPGAQAERFLHDLWQASQGLGLLRQALSAIQEVGRSAHGQGQPARGAMRVRRLTVEECEFLQGFPRGYSKIPWRKKPASECPDGPRYKALGNSWAVPVVRWIGERISMALEAVR
jgi:DNA (cytosine-5)-methyltransferase 1